MSCTINHACPPGHHHVICRHYVDEIDGLRKRLDIAEPGYQAALDELAKMRDEREREASICAEHIGHGARYKETLEIIMKIAVAAWPQPPDASDDAKRLALAVFARMSNIKAYCRAALGREGVLKDPEVAQEAINRLSRRAWSEDE